MIESSLQITCDGCGETEVHHEMDVTRQSVRDYLKLHYGWRNHGRLDYCRSCAISGAARRRETNMGLGADAKAAVAGASAESNQ